MTNDKCEKCGYWQDMEIRIKSGDLLTNMTRVEKRCMYPPCMCKEEK
jgi:hypothetical protein